MTLRSLDVGIREPKSCWSPADFSFASMSIGEGTSSALLTAFASALGSNLLKPLPSSFCVSVWLESSGVSVAESPEQAN